MNKNELKQFCLEHAGEDLPAEAKSFLDQNPAVKSEVDQLIAIRKILALKKYEQPDPRVLDRCISGVNARIENRRRASSWSRIREWFELHEQAPAPAYAAAALALVVTGSALFYSVGRSGHAPAIAEKSTAEIAPVVVAESPAETNQSAREMIADIPAAQKPIILLKVDRTGETGTGSPVTFGGDQSVPVSYER